MMLRAIIVLGASLLLAACNATAPSSTSALGPTSQDSASALAPGSAEPPTACGPVIVTLMRIHISSGGYSTADVLDTNAGNAVTGTYELVWPDGYSIQTRGGALVIVAPTGEVVAEDGSTLANVGVCGKQADVLVLDEQTITYASPSP